ncbi:hypothetical protein AB0H00_19705 [Nocardia sp. NPDC023852]|uniref:hypothetical protein n=1 Tax=Nocardia sp. NPDC023852 TaxID=3154697 RepID=UPI0033F974EF
MLIESENLRWGGATLTLIRVAVLRVQALNMLSVKRFEAVARCCGAGSSLFVAVVAAGAVSSSAPGAAVGAPGDVTTTVALSGRAATGCTVQVTATVAGSSALGLGSDIPPVEFWDDWNSLGSVTPHGESRDADDRGLPDRHH